MDPRLTSHRAVLELNHGLLLNAFEGVDDELAGRRPGGRANSLAFIACHVVDARHLLARLLGATVESPFGGRLDEARTIEEVERMPRLDEIRRAWKAIHAVVAQRLAEIDGETLDGTSPEALPVADRSLLGAVAFLLQHESYHVGQLGLVRKLLGLEGVAYPQPPPA